MTDARTEARPWGELRDSGLLWLINRVVFHPRGYALFVTMRDGEPVGWGLQGDGSEVWTFSGDEDHHFEAVQYTFAEQAAAARAPKAEPVVPEEPQP